MPNTRKTLGRFRDRAELLGFLLEVASVTAETLDLDALLANLAGIIQEIVPFDLFAILLYSEKHKGLRIRYSIGHREEVVRNLVIPLGEGLTGAAAATRRPVRVGDVHSDPRYLSVVDAVRSELAVPMLTRGRLVGVIDLESSRPNAYTEEDSTLLRLVASRVAASIDNARLYRRVERHNRTLRTLAHLSHEFASILDLDELLGKIATTVRDLINYDAFSVLLLDEDQKLLRRRFSLRLDQRVDLDNIPLGKGITGAAVELRQPILVVDTSADPRYIESTPGIRSEVAFPLLVPDRVVGVVDLESRRVGYFNDDHVRTLTLLAPMIASAVENARLYEEAALRERRMAEDLKAARHLQSLMLFRNPPEIPGLDVAARLRPAREITGDIYDFFQHGPGYAFISFGDVSGKSAAAALYGALVYGLFRTIAQQQCSPGQLLQGLNASLTERKVDAQYVTLLVLFWHAQSRLFSMANAGVFPPIVCRQGRIIKPRVEGIPLGLLDGCAYDELLFQTEPGDVFLLYSDGIHDQLNLAGEEYGRAPLYRLLEQRWPQPVQAIADAVFEDLDRFSQGAGISDDQTLLILKVS